MYIKEFKTLDEQIVILKNRGLLIKDEEQAKKYLLSQNYYNLINGYSKFFMSQDRYIEGANFNEITCLYIFEREFKQALLNAILEAETHLRSIFSYRFAEKYKDDPYAYLDIKSYEKDEILSVAQTIAKLSRTISQYEKRENGSIAHYLKKHNHVPIWVLINYLNLGELRNLLKKSVKPLQNDISKDFCDFVSQNIQGEIKVFPPETLNSFLDNINEIRNICAHNNRIIDYKCHQKVKYWKTLHDKYKIKNDERNSVYSVFVSLQCFISNTEYAVLHNTVRKRINTLSNQLHTISVDNILSKLGFPDSWHIEERKLKHKKD